MSSRLNVILVDSHIGSVELIPYIERIGVKAERAAIPADVCFEGNGPDGRILVGFERKTLHDLLHCIDDARLTAHQLIVMGQMCAVSFVVLEGEWKPDDQGSGTLYEAKDGHWFPARYRTSAVAYAKLRRYLYSLSLSKVIIIYTKNIYHTAYDICECYHWMQKKWADHTSLLEIQKLNLPSLREKPTLVRRWAADLDGIGVKLSQDAARLFKKPIELANSVESDWMKLPGVGAVTARSIYKQIQGVR